MVWAQEATLKGEGQQFEFDSSLAFAIPVDVDMAALGEDDRLKEVFKRARQHVADQEAKDVGEGSAIPPSPPGGGTGTQPGTPGSNPSHG